MTYPAPVRSRSEAALSLLAASLVAGLAVSLGGAPETAAASGPPPSPAPRSADGAVLVELVAGDDVAVAALEDTAAARDLAASLPLTLEAEDRFGQALLAPLPSGLALDDATRVLDPEPGGIYYWPAGRTIAVLTTDLGPSVPAPGLVPLGTVTSGLPGLVPSGTRVELTIRPAA